MSEMSKQMEDATLVKPYADTELFSQCVAYGVENDAALNAYVNVDAKLANLDEDDIFDEEVTAERYSAAEKVLAKHGIAIKDLINAGFKEAIESYEEYLAVKDTPEFKAKYEAYKNSYETSVDD